MTKIDSKRNTLKSRKFCVTLSFFSSNCAISINVIFLEEFNMLTINTIMKMVIEQEAPLFVNMKSDTNTKTFGEVIRCNLLEAWNYSIDIFYQDLSHLDECKVMVCFSLTSCRMI